VATTTVGLTDLKCRLVREDFADAVAWVARNLPSRPTVPVLAGVLLTGTDEGLKISGQEDQIKGSAREAWGNVKDAGNALIDNARVAKADAEVKTAHAKAFDREHEVKVEHE